MLKFYENHKKIILMILGLLCASFIALPYLFLGEGSYVEIHDQMDGEILNYIYHAKYLFKGGTIKEFMNGADPSSMIPPAPLGVLFYKFFSPFKAFALMHELELVTAFLGMFFLLLHWKIREEISFLGGILFAYLPFYPVYGLSAYGQPLLLLAAFLLVEGKKVIPILLLVYVTAFSSLSLIGYAFFGLYLLAGIVLLVKKRKKEAAALFTGTLLLLLGYILGNLDLLKSMFSSEFISHRTEMRLYPTPNVLANMAELLVRGGAYSKVYAEVILVTTVLWIVLRLTGSKKLCIRRGEDESVNKNTSDRNDLQKRIKGYDISLGILFGSLIVGSFLAAFWNGGVMGNLRIAIGGPLPYFQADRIYWMFPFAWALILMLEVEEILLLTEKLSEEKHTLVWKRAGGVVVLLLLLLQGALVFRDNVINKNLRLLLFNNYSRPTWESIYMDDVFEEMEKDMDPDWSGYSVASLGMYPSIALYHGFTCADGYSNNYPVEYKHAFRKIIADEIEQNEAYQWYFDDWGNRVYLIAQPYGFDGMVGKNQKLTYENPKFSLQAMKEMHIKYVFSAAPIVYTEEQKLGGEAKPEERWPKSEIPNPTAEGVDQTEQLKLVLVREEPYESETSYYRVWLYQLVEE